MNRDKTEQEAMNLLRRGQTDKALEKYLVILRHDPRDRRIRQKVAELYLQLGRKAEAVRHLSDVARSLRTAGQVRAAVSVFKQLVNLRPDEHELRAELAECLVEVRRLPEARRTWEEAFQLVERREPRTAIKYAQQVARLSPGEVPPKVRVAELVEKSGAQDEAFDAWVALGRDARRFGRPDDQARFLERALALKPDDMQSLLDASEARITQGDHHAALTHLQRAYGQDSRNVRLLTLLGRALQGLGQLEKARKVWIQAARRQTELGDVDARVDALRHALECGGDDPQLRAELETADTEAQRSRIRLHELGWAQPRDEDQVRVLVRASTLDSYGFPERALEVLEGASDTVKQSLSWRVRYAELLIALDRKDQGVSVLRQVSPDNDSVAADLRLRLEVLGVGRSSQPATAPAPADVDEELVDDDATDADAAQAQAQADEASEPAVDTAALEAEADRLADEGNTEAAIGLYRKVLTVDPTNMDVLRRIGELMTSGASSRRPAQREAAIAVESEPVALSVPEPTFDGVNFGEAFSEVDPDALDSLDSLIYDARALVACGLYEDAQDKLRGQDDLEAQVVHALASRGLGRLEGAQTRLERAVQGGAEHHPAYIEALWELAGVYLLRHKLGNAERILDEAEQLDPTFRSAEMAVRRRGIDLLRQR